MTTSEYNQIVEQYATRLYRFILKNIRDEERASDLVQDSFEKLWRNYRDIGFEKAKSYLFSIAHNTMIDMVRKEKRMVVKQIIQSNADLIADYNEQTLTVKLYSLAAKRYNLAVKNIVHLLNDTETIFPGTSLKLVFTISSAV